MWRDKMSSHTKSSKSASSWYSKMSKIRVNEAAEAKKSRLQEQEHYLSSLVIPALALGEDHVHARLCGDKTKGGGGTGNGTSYKVRSTVLNTNCPNEKVLAWKI
mmetsp:Transcript_26211/g.57529  ORF Transcript_26211/g.57529 Transcript_26211/m.57529 type:complete len:104 (-) Transcript_26211:85-396(-)